LLAIIEARRQKSEMRDWRLEARNKKQGARGKRLEIAGVVWNDKADL
jgi:hypothetical protein